MAAKTESVPSSKLSPPERLARKRAAARLRQQRCRARKREIMLEQRRQGEGLQAPAATQDSRAGPIKDEAQRRNPPLPFCPPKEVMSSPPREHLYNCISFDSQRSFEEGQRGAPPTAVISRSSSLQTSSVPSSPSSTGKPVEVVSVPSNQPEEPLVAQEEAAIAAMLSLKSSGSSTGSSPPSPLRPEESRPTIVTRPGPKATNMHYYRDWEVPRYSYGRQGHHVPPPYYGMGMPPHRVTPPQYRYYPAYKNKGYSRFNFE